jgi:hypothetical protein
MKTNLSCAWIVIAVGMAIYGASGVAQLLVGDGAAKKVNPKQDLIDELLAEPNYSPRMREVKEAGYVVLLQSTPGENVSKYGRGERMTDEEFRNVRQRVAHMYQVEGDAEGRLALGEAGRFFLQPMLTSTHMYELVRHSQTQLDVVYLAGVAVQPIARIEKGGAISRKDGIIKDWALPQFPVQWPFLDEKKCPIFPTPETFKGGDLVVAKDTVPAPPVPADALGWAYPLACGGMLGADSKTSPPAGDLLWVRPRPGGGLTMEYSGPNKTGVYAWFDDGLRIHWTQAPQENTTYWTCLGIDSDGTVHRYNPLPHSGIYYIGRSTIDSPVHSTRDGGAVSGRFNIGDILEIRKERAAHK